MLVRDSLAAVLRVARRTRDLKAEDFSGGIDPTHVNNLENGKVSVTLETLESVATVLDVRAISLLVLAASLREKVSPTDLLAEVKKELRAFSSLKSWRILQAKRKMTSSFLDRLELRFLRKNWLLCGACKSSNDSA